MGLFDPLLPTDHLPPAASDPMWKLKEKIFADYERNSLLAKLRMLKDQGVQFPQHTEQLLEELAKLPGKISKTILAFEDLARFRPKEYFSK